MSEDADVKAATSLARRVEVLVGRLRFLEQQIDCACNALTDSICASGNDAATNLHWVKKLRRSLGREAAAEALADAGGTDYMAR